MMRRMLIQVLDPFSWNRIFSNEKDDGDDIDNTDDANHEKHHD